MYSHVTVGTNDIGRARAFYDAALAPLGLSAKLVFPAAVGYGAGERPQFFVMRPFDRQPASVGNGMMVGFEALTRAAVDAFHAAAMAAGGRDEGAPGLHPQYHRNYYGAYVRDLDGNKLCAACHRPE